MVDIHTHSRFSFDGKYPMNEMIASACQKGLKYYGISEHFNYDYLPQINQWQGPTDVAGYFQTARRCQEEYAEKIHFLVGCEFGFTEDEKTHEDYKQILAEYKPDYVINSVHSMGGVDFSLLKKVLKKKDAIEAYLQRVRKSLDVPYHYDIVGHFSYILRYVEQGNAQELFREYYIEIKDILKTIIEKDKILEINTSTYGLAQSSLPNEQILQLYYQLGGRKVSFGSDAHDTVRIGDKQDVVVEMLKEIGFQSFTIPFRGELLQYEI